MEEVAPELAPSLDEALDRGVLLLVGDALMFRHELARITVLDEIPVSPASLRPPPGHAVAADPRRRRRLAWPTTPRLRARPRRRTSARLVAAARAAELGSHREAVEQYERALRHSPVARDRARAELLGRLSVEDYVTGRIPEARDGPSGGPGDLVRAGRRRAGRRRAAVAVALGVVPGRERDGDGVRRDGVRDARGHRWDCRGDGCQQPGAPVHADPRRGGQPVTGPPARSTWCVTASDVEAEEVRVHALNNLGTAEIDSGDEARGWELLEESLRRSQAADLHADAARAFTNLGAEAVGRHDHLRAGAVPVGRARVLRRTRPRRLGSLHARLAGPQPARPRRLRGGRSHGRRRAAPSADRGGEPDHPALRAGPRSRPDRSGRLRRAAPGGLCAVGVPDRGGAAGRPGCRWWRCEIAWLEGDDARLEQVLAEAWPVVSSTSAPGMRGLLAPWLPGRGGRRRGALAARAVPRGGDKALGRRGRRSGTRWAAPTPQPSPWPAPGPRRGWPRRSRGSTSSAPTGPPPGPGPSPGPGMVDAAASSYRDPQPSPRPDPA